MNKSDLEKIKEMFPVEFAHLLKQAKELEGWEPITLFELKELKVKELEQFKQVCWRYSELRIATFGNFLSLRVKLKENSLYELYWASEEIVFNARNVSLDDKIHKLTSDGEWFYGLYKKKKS